MKTLIVYTSQTGFTKRYAEWIAARLQVNLPSRMMMKSFAAMLKGEKAKLYAHSFDRSKEEYIEPIVSWATGAGEEEAVQKGSLVFA